MSNEPLPVIFGLKGPELTEAERGFLASSQPLGFILFARNVETPAQVTALTAALRAAVGRRAPVLIDQEGGRVQRLKPPHWRSRPAAGRIGVLARADPALGLRAAWLHGRLIAGDLAPLGIDVDCAPDVDVADAKTHAAIGDRSFGDDPDLVGALARAMAAGLAAGGVMPVIKHLPGHGRARVDSHLALPVVDASVDELEARDIRAFKAVADMPWGMTCHLLFRAIDPDNPATLSMKVINELIRKSIGFTGLLLTDDLGMNALSGTPDTRAQAALAAGCDVALHCSGDLDEMRAVAAGLKGHALRRPLPWFQDLPRSLDREPSGSDMNNSSLQDEFDSLIEKA